MHAFHVKVNGNTVAVVGIPGDSVVSAIVNKNGPDGSPMGLFLSLSGLNSLTGQHVTWDAPDIDVGDEVTITVIETDDVTPPTPVSFDPN